MLIVLCLYMFYLLCYYYFKLACVLRILVMLVWVLVDWFVVFEVCAFGRLIDCGWLLV